MWCQRIDEAGSLLKLALPWGEPSEFYFLSFSPKVVSVVDLCSGGGSSSISWFGAFPTTSLHQLQRWTGCAWCVRGEHLRAGRDLRGRWSGLGTLQRSEAGAARPAPRVPLGDAWFSQRGYTETWCGRTSWEGRRFPQKVFRAGAFLKKERLDDRQR